MTQQQVRDLIEANTSIPNEAYEMLLNEAEEKEHSYKQLWAKAFKRFDGDFAEASDCIMKLCSQVGAWSPREMTLEQINKAYSLLNYV